MFGGANVVADKIVSGLGADGIVMRRQILGVLFSFFVCLNLAAVAQEKAGQPWWQHAVFYEIYPRSFADSNNDGLAISRALHQNSTTCTGWASMPSGLRPCFLRRRSISGMTCRTMKTWTPIYGTLADMDQLIAEGKKRDIRIILDFVVNHTSDQHPWFIESRSSKTNPKRDWYIWRDGKSAGQPPNNWTSLFGGPAWRFDPATNQWYYHYFYAAQPDLNWRNPEVETAMFDVARWWYRRGAAGFRLDAVTNLFEDAELTDNPLVDHQINAYGDPVHQQIHNLELPELHGVLQRLRKVSDEYDCVLIGETWTDTLDQLKLYYGQHGNELQLPIDFRFFAVGKISAPEFRKQIADAESFEGQPVYVFSNHDEPRQYTKYGDGQHNDQIAKLLASLYLTLRGTPILYYGEEIGMENNDPKTKEDVQDPIGKLGWPKDKGRDGERTPMQWNTQPNAGFSQVKPWNPVDALYRQYNVEAERRDPNSILNYYRNLPSLRHTNPALLDGKYVALNQDDPNVLAYVRSYAGKHVLIVLNMSGSHQAIKLDLPSKGISAKSSKVLLASFKTPERGNINKIDLEPFGAYIAQLK